MHGVRAQAHGKTLETIRGQQGTVDTLIGHEHYLRIERLRTHSDWLRNYPKIRVTGISIISGYASSRLVATKHYLEYYVVSPSNSSLLSVYGRIT